MQCVGCGKWDTVFCRECMLFSDVVVGDWVIISDPDSGAECAMWTLCPYEGIMRRLVLTAKNSRHVDFTDFLRRAGLNLGKAVARSSLVGYQQEIWVVPAPSGWRRRFDGRLIVGIIARGVAEALAQSSHRGCCVRVVDALRLKAFSGSQSKRNKAQRLRGRYNSMRSVVGVVPQGVSVVLVDDVVTTGATIREMCRVLGPRCVGVVALCNVRAEMRR